MNADAGLQEVKRSEVKNFALTPPIGDTCPATSKANPPVSNALKNQDVLEMHQAGLSAEIIVAKIKASKTNFDTSLSALKELKAADVPESVILAMVQAPTENTAEDITSSSSTDDDAPKSLVSVKSIYIGAITGEDSELVAEKIRAKLEKSGQFIVVSNPDQADAILTGTAGVNTGYGGSISTNPATGQVSGSTGTTYSGFGVLRLVEPASQKTIWRFEYKRGFCFRCSASGRVADQFVERLNKDLKKLKNSSK